MPSTESKHRPTLPPPTLGDGVFCCFLPGTPYSLVRMVHGCSRVDQKYIQLQDGRNREMH